ncbi:hypothetical protein BCR44DRAFT_1437080 [Catenaria anguillulae PL171]|uniref:Uncharacterized protein n=1 Tax=Catenaria anguillulae PL171 TaxID=765915 RepID=A0A1Y2HJS0_9FUNG|nr:hypothetical protein BCR44DRAFT_1437080 [Catenaria anguillulae PL171]
MLALGQSKSTVATSPVPASHRGSHISNIRKSLSSLIPKYPTVRSTATLSSSSHTNTSDTHGTSTVDSERHRSIAVLAQERADESREAERRVLKRGAFSFLSYSFVYPFCYFIWLGVRYGARPNTVFDLVFCATKFISEMSDPIILFSLDRGFNAELRKLLRSPRKPTNHP